MFDIKQSTARNILFFAHDVNGDAVAGLADGSWTKTFSKGGAASLAAMTITITNVSSGWYSCQLSASHTDTLGQLTIVFINASTKQVNLMFNVSARVIDDVSTYAGGAVASVSGDVAGKVLGGGAGTMTAAGVRAVDGSGNAIAPASLLPAALVSGRMDASVGAMAANVLTAGAINTGAITAAKFAADAIDAAALKADAATEIAASVWATQTGLGKTALLALAEINAAQVLRLGQFQAGSTTQTIVLDSGASAVDDFYNRTTITIVTGASAGQNRLINDYVGSTRTAYLDRPLLVGAPALNDWFAIDSRGNVRSATDSTIGLATAGGASTITLQVGSSAQNDFYNRMVLLIESGTGEGQARMIDSYVGATRVATVARPWVTQPDATSRYVILPYGSVKVAEIDAEPLADVAAAVWAEVLEGTLSAAAFQRILLAFAAGITTDDGKEFYDIAGTKKRIDGTMTGKNRTVAVLDGTP